MDTAQHNNHKMKKIIIYYLFLIFALFFTNCNNSKMKKEVMDSGQESSADYSMKINSLLKTESPRKFNGVILITQSGETKYLKEYGYSNFEKETLISINDNFRIQSNSKQITAVIILKEVEKGNILLDSSIKTYLPELTSTWADSVTVHHLLNMSSGIIDIDQPLIFESGTDYKYSNPSYALLGRIIKKVTGKKYSEVANDLFKELNMDNSYCYDENSTDSKLINGYINTNGKYTLMEFNDPGFTQEWWTDFFPAGGIISNANDLDRWETELHNGSILNPETYDLMTSYSIEGKHSVFGEEKIGYGYGVRIDDKNPIKIIGHSGRGLGFVSMKFHIPKTNVNVVILENVHTEDNDAVYYFENEIRKIVLNSSLIKS